MSKLFAGEDFDIELPTSQTIEAKIENSDIPDIIETHETSIQVAVEGVLKATNDLYIVNDIRASLESKKLSSVEYFTSIENYSLYMKSISNNLGIKTKIPSMEDFKNPYGAKTSHQFVMEGFMEFIRSIWQKIKSFFKDFFKRILLFFKRLVNANLEMEEYEEYIEGMMHNVKKSDKKNVEPIKINSKLPSMLSDFGMDSMGTDFLFSKGQTKLQNLSKLINVLTDKHIVNFETQLKDINITISRQFVQGYKPLPDEARDISSNARNMYINNFTKNLFGSETTLNSLPERVNSEVLNNFDSNQLGGNNARFYSIINDRDASETLPKNFNVYLAISQYDTSDDQNNVRTGKLLVISNMEKNTHIVNSMDTIGSRDNLLRFYEFYKKFSKDLKIKDINKRMVDFSNSIRVMTESLDEPFAHALETNSPIIGIGKVSDMLDEGTYEAAGKAFQDPAFQAMMAPTIVERDNTDSDKGGQSDTNQLSNILPAGELSPGYSHSSSGGNRSSDSGPKQNVDDPSRRQTRREFEHLQRFIFNYMNCVQSFLKEYSVNIAATGQECRYEMIKLLYKSAKQF